MKSNFINEAEKLKTITITIKTRKVNYFQMSTGNVIKVLMVMDVVLVVVMRCWDNELDSGSN